MTKELEALKRIRQETCPATYMDDFDKNECCDVIEQALLKAQENARSEEILQKYYQEGITLDSVRALREENAELRQKTQEPKHYLKWEDLEFEEDNETKIKVRMGEHIYDLWYGSYKTGYGTFKQKCSLAGYEFDEDYDIDIFNDLHLERVE